MSDRISDFPAFESWFRQNYPLGEVKGTATELRDAYQAAYQSRDAEVAELVRALENCTQIISLDQDVDHAVVSLKATEDARYVLAKHKREG